MGWRGSSMLRSQSWSDCAANRCDDGTEGDLTSDSDKDTRICAVPHKRGTAGVRSCARVTCQVVGHLQGTAGFCSHCVHQWCWPKWCAVALPVVYHQRGMCSVRQVNPCQGQASE